LTRNDKLLQSIVKFDFASYKELTTDDLTGIEPGSHGETVSSKAFHRYYFDKVVGYRKEPASVSIVTPCVRFLSGDVAVTSYIRLDQFIRDGKADTIRTSETRIWEKQNGKWVNCHYHQS
jgi:calcium/calmodulin-dependent protein kinase (CaM kinase) II